jgi:Flp pilus assembly protein CpaB
LTVLVTPEDGEKLIHASAQGRIQLALRNMMDVREIRTSGARVAGLLTGASGPTRGPVQARAVQPSAEEVAPATIEVVKGGVRTLKRF